jgi:Domain of unknown function (DUF4149)
MQMQRLPIFLAALWWGSASAIGFWVVPLLFLSLETPAMAGKVAAQFFTAQTWVALVCGLLLLLLSQRQARQQYDQTLTEASSESTPSSFRWTPSGWLIAGMLMALLIEVAVKPHLLAHENMVLWHNLGSAFYLGQWWCAGVMLWRLTACASSPAPTQA